MTWYPDREFYSVLIAHARGVLNAAARELDGDAAPHVMNERLRKMRKVSERLAALADMAEAERR